MTSVTIPGSVKTIYGFDGCTGLTSITIPNGVETIGYGAFYNCTGLTSVTIPGSVKSLDGFSYCTGLTSITIPNGVEEIGSSAFDGCTGLTSVTIPGSVKTIGGFDSCTGIKRIVFEGEAPQSVKYFSFNNVVANAYYPSNAASWTESKRNEFPDSLTWIPYSGEAPKAGSEKRQIIEGAYGTEGQYKTATFSGLSPNERCILVVTTSTLEPLKNLLYINQTNADSNGVAEFSYCLNGEYEEIYIIGYNESSEAEEIEKPCDGGEGCPSGKFVDVDSKQWYHPYVDYAVTHGLFGGTSANTFEPESAMTRAMLVTVLWRYEGQPKGYQNTFVDVNAKSGSWYIDAVAWAAANKIVGGVGNGKFDPEGKITREQMATILFRYAKWKGIDTSKRGDLSVFPDGSKVESWAKEAMQWTVAEKIIGGSDGKLLPQGSATRAQVATILMRFIENIVNVNK